MKTAPRAIGARVVEARKIVGMSQRDLAEESSLSQSTIHRIETGEREASASELATIADSCGVLVDDLLGTNTLSEHVRCAGRTSDSGAGEMVNYLIYAFGMEQRLNELGVPEAL